MERLRLESTKSTAAKASRAEKAEAAACVSKKRYWHSTAMDRVGPRKDTTYPGIVSVGPPLALGDQRSRERQQSWEVGFCRIPLSASGLVLDEAELSAYNDGCSAQCVEESFVALCSVCIASLP